MMVERRVSGKIGRYIPAGGILVCRETLCGLESSSSCEVRGGRQKGLLEVRVCRL